MSVFGALNRFISRLDAEPKQQDTGTGGAHGFQVLRNSNKDVPLEPWFDFIIGINGHNIDNADPNLFATEVRNCAGASVELGVWSAKGQRIRSTYAQVPTNPPSLGLSLQWMPLAATEDVWHILDVAPNSPADVAGLLPYGDYVIGSPEGLVKGETGLGELVEDYMNQPLRLHVYNHEYDVTRLVVIEPSRSWGGTGALGCMLGFGALHRIPAPLNEPPQAPGETLFETARLSSEAPFRTSMSQEAQEPPPRTDSTTPQYIVPAEMNMPSAAPPADSSGSSKPLQGRRNRGGHSQRRGPAMDMDEFLQEGEAKSKEQDFAPSPRPNADAIAPPPKASKPAEEPTDSNE